MNFEIIFFFKLLINEIGPITLLLSKFEIQKTDYQLCLKKLGIGPTIFEILSCVYGEGFSTMLQYRVSDLTSREQKADCNECIL